jgi:hypothetical protein
MSIERTRRLQSKLADCPSNRTLVKHGEFPRLIAAFNARPTIRAAHQIRFHASDAARCSALISARVGGALKGPRPAPILEFITRTRPGFQVRTALTHLAAFARVMIQM